MSAQWGQWEYIEEYRSWRYLNGTAHIELAPRGGWCDRGRWIATVTGVGDINEADAFPRYFMSLERAKAEMAEWLDWRMTTYVDNESVRQSDPVGALRLRRRSADDSANGAPVSALAGDDEMVLACGVASCLDHLSVEGRARLEALDGPYVQVTCAQCGQPCLMGRSSRATVASGRVSKVICSTCLMAYAKNLAEFVR